VEITGIHLLALADGANEIDMVLNLEKIKNHNFDFIENELIALRKSTESTTAKAILETTLLDDKEIICICQIASELGIDPGHAAIVEDSIAGVEAGRKGNFKLVIGVDRAGHGDELKKQGADIVVNDLAELLT